MIYWNLLADESSFQTKRVNGLKYEHPSKMKDIHVCKEHKSDEFTDGP